MINKLNPSFDFPLELRAWIERDKIMLYQEDQFLISFLRRSYLINSGGQNQHPGYGEPPFMFWTGRYDKNKKKIFSKDYIIIKELRVSGVKGWAFANFESPHEVIWDGEKFIISDQLKNGISLSYFTESEDLFEVIVVGNTFEHPDGFICPECQFEEARHSLECSKKTK